MLYIGYLININGQNVKKSVSSLSFSINRLCPNPAESRPSKRPNRVKNT